MSYNLNYFPYVIVTFNETLTNDQCFYDFTNQWLQLYKYKKPFILIFDTLKLKDVSLKYCFYMSAFITQIRKQPIQYLQKSYIIIQNKQLTNLLDIIFYLQPPVADVYIVEQSLPPILNNIAIQEYLKYIGIVKKINTKQPFFTFL